MIKSLEHFLFDLGLNDSVMVSLTTQTDSTDGLLRGQDFEKLLTAIKADAVYYRQTKVFKENEVTLVLRTRVGGFWADLRMKFTPAVLGTNFSLVVEGVSYADRDGRLTTVPSLAIATLLAERENRL